VRCGEWTEGALSALRHVAVAVSARPDGRLASVSRLDELSPHRPYYPRWFNERLRDAAGEKALAD
jgi:hypothetical protein